MFRMFPDFLTQPSGANANHVALVAKNSTLTYARLLTLTRQLARQLDAAGVRPMDRVGIHLHHCPQEIIATFATSFLGAVFVNVHYHWTPSQLAHVMQDCQIKFLITDRRKMKYLESYRADFPSLEQFLAVDAIAEDQEQPIVDTSPLESEIPHLKTDNNDIAAILYTSGSTGPPKGVMLSHRNLIDGAKSVTQYLKNTQADRVLSVLPFCFGYGLSQLTTMFMVGGTLILQPVALANEIVRALVAHRATGMAAVPTIWHQVVRFLLEEPAMFPHLRYITNAGGALAPDILEALPATFPNSEIFLMYGLTEAFRTTYLPPELFEKKKGSIGEAIPGAETYVIDPEIGICGPGQEGELIQRGSLICLGYWGNPQATAEKIKPCPQLKHLIGDEKVVYTGDIVRIDEEGYYWFVGRRDELIKCSGFRISPTEVEALLSRCDLVADVVAFGRPNTDLGQEVCVAVKVLDPPQTDTGRLLSAYCTQTMPRYMVPRAFFFWDGDMPLSASGKIDRPTVVHRCKNGQVKEFVK